MSNTRIVLTLLVSLVVGSSTATAKQYVRHVHGKEVVVHTNPIPVVLHRLVPPQHGRHVTEREIRAGKLPQAGR
jgi:hypothetical protein